MRSLLTFAALALAGVASTAQATTIVIMVDATTLERRTVVIPTPGVDRFLLCAAPPALSGCRDLTGRH